jgi:hypothetical protein
MAQQSVKDGGFRFRRPAKPKRFAACLSSGFKLLANF